MNNARERKTDSSMSPDHWFRLFLSPEQLLKARSHPGGKTNDMHLFINHPFAVLKIVFTSQPTLMENIYTVFSSKYPSNAKRPLNHGLTHISAKPRFLIPEFKLRLFWIVSGDPLFAKNRNGRLTASPSLRFAVIGYVGDSVVKN
jgi:hypothetical protein